METNKTIAAGKQYRLRVREAREMGLLLDGKEMGSLLLPKRYVPKGAKPDDMLEVFVYHDSEDRLIATTETPKVHVHQCAYLKVADVNRHGAFLDWGLPKHLLAPYSEQAQPMQVGRSYLVYVYADRLSHRLVASSKLHKYIKETGHAYKKNDEVAAQVAAKTDLGYKLVLDHQYWGVLYHNTVKQHLAMGQQVHVRVAKVRADNKLDVVLVPQEDFDEIAQKVLQRLDEAKGFLAIHDKSDPQLIAKVFGVSKKRYKQVLGALKSQGKIAIEPQGIRRID